MICACALGQAYGDSGLERWVDRSADLAEAFARKAEGSKGAFPACAASITLQRVLLVGAASAAALQAR